MTEKLTNSKKAYDATAVEGIINKHNSLQKASSIKKVTAAALVILALFIIIHAATPALRQSLAKEVSLGAIGKVKLATLIYGSYSIGFLALFVTLLAAHALGRRPLILKDHKLTPITIDPNKAEKHLPEQTQNTKSKEVTRAQEIIDQLTVENSAIKERSDNSEMQLEEAEQLITTLEHKISGLEVMKRNLETTLSTMQTEENGNIDALYQHLEQQELQLQRVTALYETAKQRWTQEHQRAEMLQTRTTQYLEERNEMEEAFSAESLRASQLQQQLDNVEEDFDSAMFEIEKIHKENIEKLQEDHEEEIQELYEEHLEILHEERPEIPGKYHAYINDDSDSEDDEKTPTKLGGVFEAFDPEIELMHEEKVTRGENGHNPHPTSFSPTTRRNKSSAKSPTITSPHRANGASRKTTPPKESLNPGINTPSTPKSPKMNGHKKPSIHLQNGHQPSDTDTEDNSQVVTPSAEQLETARVASLARARNMYNSIISNGQAQKTVQKPPPPSGPKPRKAVLQDE
jgi:hypothetical protein